MPKRSAYQYQGYLVFGNGIRKPYFVFVDTKPEDDRMIGFRAAKKLHPLRNCNP